MASRWDASETRAIRWSSPPCAPPPRLRCTSLRLRTRWSAPTRGVARADQLGSERAQRAKPRERADNRCSAASDVGATVGARERAGESEGRSPSEVLDDALERIVERAGQGLDDRRHVALRGCID